MRSHLWTLLDRLDERRARALRRRLGAVGWLVSWHRADAPHPRGRPWLARVSCPGSPETVEATARGRVRAARRALRRLEAALVEARPDPSIETHS